MSYFITKQFGAYSLDSVDYWRCDKCGFVISKTHAEMPPAAWERVNYEWHVSYQGKDNDDRDPKWITRLQNQAEMLNDVQQLGLLDKAGQWLDYACGDAKLSGLLRMRYNLTLLNYERYMRQKEGFIEGDKLVPEGFDFVITTAVFEHLTLRKHFDAINSLVASNGVLGLHTLVCENIPADPAWFYLNPSHCAFHTNKSMEILFRQWGYTSSVYNVHAQLWLWFKKDAEQVEAIIHRANGRAGGPFYVFKHDFVDYWKCVPIHQTQDKIPTLAEHWIRRTANPCDR